jgi:hypothetical protein
MPLLSNHAARVALQQCIVNQGGLCYICKDLKLPLILEHIDNNRKNNPDDGSNWGAACVSCNVKKGKAAKANQNNDKKHSARRESVRVGGHEDNGLGSVEELEGGREIAISTIKRPQFRKWVKKVVKEEGCPRAKRLLDGGHEKLGMSQRAAGRWLDGMCSPEGEFEYVQDEAGRNCVRYKNNG